MQTSCQRSSFSSRYKSSQGGFTLVELAIVMIIIGLLIGGVLKGQQLIENARVTALINQSRAYQSAVLSFKDTYANLPGDMRTATTKLAGCDAAAGCVDGNGNGLLGASDCWYCTVNPAISSENTQFWKHLALADLITGVNPSATTVAWGETHPASQLRGGFFARFATGTSTATNPLYSGTLLILRNNIAGEWNCGTASGSYVGAVCTISPRMAAQIDRKIDDGYASSGSVWGISLGWGAGCGRGNVGTNDETGYTPSSNSKTCEIMFTID